MNKLVTLFFCFSILNLSAQVMVTTITPEIDASGGVHLDKEGNLYIANFGAELGNADGTQIWRLDTEGNLETWATGFQGASGNAFDSQGNLFQSNIAGSFISKVTPDGQASTFVSNGISGPVGIAIDSEDNLYVANCGNNTIRKVTPLGVSTQYAGGQIFNCPNGITLDHENNLYVANFGNGNIIKITPSGTTSAFESIPGSNNGHLIFCPVDTVLYVNSHGSSRVYRVDLEGNRTTVAGSGIRGNDDGPATTATFSRPNGVAVTPSGDTLYLNSSIPTVDNPGMGFWPLNPSVVRMITGLNPVDTVSAVEEPWKYEGLELQTYPNPANTNTTMTYELPMDLDIQLQVFDANGQLIKTLVEGFRKQGKYELEVNISDLSAGVYEYTIIGEEFVLARRLFVVK